MGNPFTQLADIFSGQVFIQLRLTKQDYLHQFMAMGFQVAQQANFFKGFNRHALGFFDENYNCPPFTVFFNQIVLQLVHDHESLRGRIHIQVQFKGDGINNIFCRKTGIGQINDFNLIRQTLLQHAAKHGFTTANLTDNLDDSFTGSDCINQGIEDDTGAIGTTGKKH